MQKKDEKMSRRTFMKQTATVAVATMAAPLFIPNRVFGANDHIRIAVFACTESDNDELLLKSVPDFSNVTT